MMNKVKPVIMLILLLILIGFVYAFITRQRESQISTTPLPIPEIPKTYQGEQKIAIEIKEEDFKFPNTLPVLNAAPSSISDEESKALASRLGFNFEPAVVPDVFEGTKHRYSGDDYVLLIVLGVGKIDYERNLILGEVANKQLSDAQIIKIAEDFLIQNELATADEIITLSVSYYEERGAEGLYQTERESAYFYQVNFSTSISEIPILTLNPQNSPVYVRVLPDGTILKAHVEKLGQVSKSELTYRLKNYNDVVNSKDQSTLISLDEGNIYLPDIPKNSIKQITVTEIGLAYLLEPTLTRTLQPIFLLKGKASVAGFPSDVSAVLYLPAVKNP